MKGCGTETDIFHIIILITFILGFKSKHCAQGYAWKAGNLSLAQNFYFYLCSNPR